MNGFPLVFGGLGTGLVAGVLFGARHALEPDHVAAVASLVEDESRPGRTGAAWGTGHSLPILFLGGLFLALDLQIPPTIATAFELLVAVILICLGVRTLAGREAFGLAVLRHAHGSVDTAGGQHRHLTVAGRRIGLLHTHEDEESLAVGVIHGLAGSGGVVIALAAASQTTAGGTAFLLGFSLASVLAMGLAAWTWGQAIGQSRKLRLVAGGASVLVGLLLFAEIVRVTPPI